MKVGSADQKFQLVSDAEMGTIVTSIKQSEPLDSNLATRLKLYGPSQRAAIAVDVAMALRSEIENGWVPQNGSTKTAEIAGRLTHVSGATFNRAMVVKRINPASFDLIYRGESTIEEEYRINYQRPLANGKIQKLSPLPSLRNVKASKDRIVRGLSQVRGICSWLPEEASDAVNRILTAEEIEIWAGIARSAAGTLNKLALHFERRNGHE